LLIGAMREYFKGLKLILLFVIVAFIATSLFYFGSGSLRATGERSSAPATVNGEDVPAGRFQRMQKNYLEYYRRAYRQDITPEMAERMGLTRQVINDLVQEALIIQQAAREGIKVGDDELRLRIQSIPAFQEDGRFSRDRYLAQLQQARLDPGEFETEVRRDLTRQRMEALVKDGIKISDAEVDQAYMSRFERVRAEWAHIESTPLLAEVTVSDADAEAYMKTHEAQFSRPERRRVQYVLIAPKAFAKAVPDADAEAYYKEHRAEFERPKRLKTAHILARVPPTGGEAEDKSRAKIEEAIRRARAGEDFGKLAKELSEDAATAPLGGDLGFVGKGEMVPQFEEAVFALKKGEISPQPVRTPFGYHAIKVSDVQDSGVQPFRDAAVKIKEKLAAERSERAAQAKADEARPALAAAKDFAAEAKKLGLDVKDATVARGDGIEGIGRDPQLEEAIFGLAVGGVTQPIKTPGGFVITHVVESFPAGLPPFAEIKDKAVNAVKRERAGVLAEERARAFAASVEKGGDFLATARRDKFSVGATPFFSRGEPPKDKEAVPGAVLLAAPQVPTGRISEPVRAATGFYVVKTVERRAADPQGFDKVRDQLRVQLLEAKRNQAWERWVKARFAGAKIQVQGETVPER